jgi:hypothetical protein
MEPDLLLGQLVLQLHGGYYPVDCLILLVEWVGGMAELYQCRSVPLAWWMLIVLLPELFTVPGYSYRKRWNQARGCPRPY